MHSCSSYYAQERTGVQSGFLTTLTFLSLMLSRWSTDCSTQVIWTNWAKSSLQSPHIALFTIRECGITMEQVREYCDTLPHYHTEREQPELAIWLSRLKNRT
ncbi:hypothetical protein Pelo_19097 [Pelomyxa schiedti]|nr:hypothetical protein Pelo_19097 [Pelomyxa schiedti]